MSNNQDPVQGYLSKITRHLAEQGFHFSRDTKFKSQTFELVARRTRFEIEKGGFAATSYLFASLSNSDIEKLREFSAICFQYALRYGGIRPPRGIFYSICCFSVAIVDSIGTDTGESIRRKAPPKHWSASEMPVVYSLEQEDLYFCEITPRWGSLYYDQMRSDIKQMLSP